MTREALLFWADWWMFLARFYGQCGFTGQARAAGRLEAIFRARAEALDRDGRTTAD